MDAAADDPPALAHRGERGRNERADGRGQDGGVERRWRPLVRSARPFGAERQREALGGEVAWPGEGEDAPSLPAADLRDDMRRRAKTVDADRAPVARGLERAPADEARAKERRGGDRVEVFVQGKGESSVGDRMGREPAVARVAGEQRRIAQVLSPAGAIGAMSARMAELGDADARAEREINAGAGRLDPADDLMSRDDRQFWSGEVAVDHMQLGAANAAGLDPNPNLPGPGPGFGPLLQQEPIAGPPQDHGGHGGD